MTTRQPPQRIAFLDGNRSYCCQWYNFRRRRRPGLGFFCTLSGLAWNRGIFRDGDILFGQRQDDCLLAGTS